MPPKKLEADRAALTDRLSLAQETLKRASLVISAVRGTGDPTEHHGAVSVSAQGATANNAASLDEEDAVDLIAQAQASLELAVRDACERHGPELRHSIEQRRVAILTGDENTENASALRRSVLDLTRTYAPCLAICASVGSWEDEELYTGELAVNWLVENRTLDDVVPALAAVKHGFLMMVQNLAEAVGIPEQNLHTAINQHLDHLSTNEAA